VRVIPPITSVASTAMMMINIDWPVEGSKFAHDAIQYNPSTLTGPYNRMSIYVVR